MKKNLSTLIFLLIGFAVVAQSAVKQELYKSARRNFARGKYIDAIRDFSTFQGANEGYLNQHVDLKNAISSAITICEQKIEAKKTEVTSEQPQSNRYSSQIQVEAKSEEPFPIFLMAEDTVIQSMVKSEFISYLDRMKKNPFSGYEFICLTNISTDSIEQYDYAMDRISLFKDVIEEYGISSKQITWTVRNIANSAYRLSDCLYGHTPEKGSLCLEVNYNHRLSKFELEP